MVLQRDFDVLRIRERGGRNAVEDHARGEFGDVDGGCEREGSAHAETGDADLVLVLMLSYWRHAPL